MTRQHPVPNIRVVQLLHGYLPLLGGAERQVASVAEYLLGEGVETHVLTRRTAGLARLEDMGGVTVHRLPAPPPKPVAALSFMSSALAKIRVLEPDLVHGHILFTPAMTAALAGVLFGVPTVATPHRSGPLGDVDRLLAKPLGRRRLRFMERRIGAFTVISSEIDAELDAVGIPTEKRVAIANGVDTDRFSPVSMQQAHALRRELGIDGDPVVLFLGRLAAEKRVDLLLQAWPSIRRRLPSATLAIGGDGPLASELRASRSEGVRFLGHLGDVVPYLQASNLFVLPSLAEGFSVALLEALATGTPTVATEVGGAGDLITDGLDGLLIPPNDVEALKAAMLRPLEDADLARRLSTAGRRLITERYSIGHVGELTLGLYQREIARHQAANQTI